MRMTTMIALASLLAVTAAGAQSKPTTPDGPTLTDTLTVEDALNVGAGLQQLASVETTDKDGKTIKTYFKFNSKTRIDIAVNLEASRRAQSHFQDARNAIVMSMSNGTGKVEDDKVSLLNLEVGKLMKEKARAEFIKIKMSELKLDDNDIPGPVLSLILPIIER